MTVEDDKYKAFARHFTRHEGALRVFVRSLLPSWDDADEVMQAVSLVTWKKFDQFDTNTDFMRWAAAIARFEVLNYRRSKARDRLVLDEDVMALLARECQESEEDRAAERRALDICLKRIPEPQRLLVLRAFTPGCRMKDMAEQIGVSANALYKRVDRIKQALFRCVRQTVVVKP